jgi:hypothetical protein
MSDNGTLFPNILQPAATLKAYAPMGVKFWETGSQNLSCAVQEMQRQGGA